MVGKNNDGTPLNGHKFPKFYVICTLVQCFILVHQVSVTGNCLPFCRLFVLVLCDMFIEQQNDVAPSPDCSLENSQLDLFDLISQFDIMTMVKQKGNVKKLAALEKRFQLGFGPGKFELLNEYIQL